MSINLSAGFSPFSLMALKGFLTTLQIATYLQLTRLAELMPIKKAIIMAWSQDLQSCNLSTLSIYYNMILYALTSALFFFIIIRHRYNLPSILHQLGYNSLL